MSTHLNLVMALASILTLSLHLGGSHGHVCALPLSIFMSACMYDVCVYVCMHVRMHTFNMHV